MIMAPHPTFEYSCPNCFHREIVYYIDDSDVEDCNYFLGTVICHLKVLTECSSCGLPIGVVYRYDNSRPGVHY